MRTKLVAIGLLCFSSSAFAVNHSPELLPAINLAKGNIRKALTHQGLAAQPVLKEIFTSMLTAIEETDITLLADENTEYFCQSSTRGGVRIAETVFLYMPLIGEFSPRIHVCPAVKKVKAVETIAQAIIHEAFHATGRNFEFGNVTLSYRAECHATELEIALTTMAGAIPYKNGYVSLCRLDKYVDPLRKFWVNWIFAGRVQRDKFSNEDLSVEMSRHLDVQIMKKGVLNPEIDFQWRDFFRSNAGLTPLMTAVWNGKYEWAEFMLQNGAKASLEIADAQGYTALKAANARHDQKMADLLIKYGAKVPQPSKEEPPL